jgi:hypothetical protein
VGSGLHETDDSPSIVTVQARLFTFQSFLKEKVSQDIDNYFEGIIHGVSALTVFKSFD